MREGEREQLSRRRNRSTPRPAIRKPPVKKKKYTGTAKHVLSHTSLGVHFRLRLPRRLFNPSFRWVALGRDPLATTSLALELRWRTSTGVSPLLLPVPLSRRRPWGIISYTPRLSLLRTDCERAMPAASEAFRCLSMVNPGSPLPLRSSGWYCCGAQVNIVPISPQTGDHREDSV